MIFGANRVNYYPIKQSRASGGLSRIAYKIKGSNTGKRQAYSLITAIDCEPTQLRQPSSIQKFNTEVGLAPTQKPVALYEYLIKTYTQEGELILDNTAGSGTLAIAAINTNRNYICIEKDEHYFEVMRNRIANHDPNVPIKTKKPKPVPKGQLALF